MYATDFVPQLMYPGEKTDWCFNTTEGGARTFNIDDRLLNKCKLIIEIDYSSNGMIIILFSLF